MIDKSRLKSIEAITPVTDEEAELRLLKRLKNPVAETEQLGVLWTLTDFYHRIVGRIDIATACALLILESTRDNEEQARCYRSLGVFAEHRREYELAIEYYVKGLALKPGNKFVAYFLHNNMAYCLNIVGQLGEAEAMCRKAIEIDASRHNAWKNLGLSLEGKGDLIGAAYSYIEATNRNPRDPRAVMLFERLLDANPELQSKFPHVLVEEAECKQTVKTEMRKQGPVNHPTFEICRLKKIPEQGYWLFRDGVEYPISENAIKEVYTLDALVMLDNHPNIWVQIVAEDPEAKFEARNRNATTSLDIVPCLVASGDFLKRLQKH